MKMKMDECLQWPILFIFLFWWKANTPVVTIVAEIKPETIRCIITFEEKCDISELRVNEVYFISTGEEMSLYHSSIIEFSR